jgi:type I restriction enzyme S subunit
MIRIQPGDLVISGINAAKGAVAIYGSDQPGPIAATIHYSSYAPIQDAVDVRFLWWLFRSGFFRQVLSDQVPGGIKTELKPSRLLPITIPLPPLAEQQSILARIDALASRIEEAKKLRAQAAAEVEALYNSEVSQIRNALEHRYGVRRLASLIINAGYGTSTKCSYDHEFGTVPVLRIPNVVSESIDRTDLKYGRIAIPEYGRVMLTVGDILIVRTNGSAELVGRSAVVESVPESTAFASYLIRIQCDTGSVRPHYVQRMLRHLRTSGQLFDLARTTAGQYNVSLGRLREATIPVPPFALPIPSPKLG